MTWPTQPISTEQLQTDSGNPTLARAEIELAAQAVSAIIDTIQPQSAESADILNYSGSSFLPVDLISVIGIPVKIALLNMGGATGPDNTKFSFGTNLHTNAVNISVTVDPNNIISVANNLLTLLPGSYLFMPAERNIVATQNFASTINLRAAIGSDPETTDQIFSAAFTETGVIGGTRFHLMPNMQFLRIVNTTEIISFWVDGPSAIPLNNLDDLLVIKLV